MSWTTSSSGRKVASKYLACNPGVDDDLPIKVRVAVRRIVERGQFHPEQLDAFLTIAFEVAPHPLIARAAISEGVRDGLERRAAANDN